LVFVALSWRPLRTSWLIVGTWVVPFPSQLSVPSALPGTIMLLLLCL
jgi:hypothetical protein